MREIFSPGAVSPNHTSTPIIDPRDGVVLKNVFSVSSKTATVVGGGRVEVNGFGYHTAIVGFNWQRDRECNFVENL